MLVRSIGTKLCFNRVLLRGFLKDVLPGQEVSPRLEQHALRLQAVAAGPARFLLIMLDRFGHAGVQHEAHIGAVDAHAERHGGDHQIALSPREKLPALRLAILGVMPAW